MSEKMHKTELDEKFYQEKLRDRVPARICDIHVHVNLPEHIGPMTRERLLSDWAFECGLVLPCEEALAIAAEMFRDTAYSIAGFPWPIKEAKMAENNQYLLRKKEEHLLSPFMGTRPEWNADYVEAQLAGFAGYKPYPDLVTEVKGADVSIFSFMPHHQLEVLNRHKKAVVIHLPRKNRIADQDNLRELMTIRQKYPEISIIIAHFGRSFCPIYLKTAIDELGDDIRGFYFDSAAVINPATYDLAFARLPRTRLMYGSDAPILYWHGKRYWTETAYFNLCAENYTWNKHSEGPEKESHYTLFMYEQMKAILDAMDRQGLTAAEKDAFFYSNARQLLDRCLGENG